MSARASIPIDFTITYTHDANGNRTLEAGPTQLVASVDPASAAQLTMPAAGGAQALSSTATASAHFGQTPYSYAWTLISGSGIANSGGTTPTFSSSCGSVGGCDNKAVFQVTVTDALNATATAQVTVEHKFLAAVPTVAITPGSSFTQMTLPAGGGTQSLSAAVSATVTNGQAPFSYAWSPVSGYGFSVTNGATNNPTFGSSCAASPAVGCDDVGTYQLTVTDALGRTASAQVGLEQKYLTAVPSVAISPSSSFVQRNMITNGGAQSLSASVSASTANGQAPLSYAWSLVSGYGFSVANGTTLTPTFSATCTADPSVGCDDVGTYQLTVTDGYGRTAAAQVTVEQRFNKAVPPVVSVSPASLALSGSTAASANTLMGSSTASVTDGVAPYAYAWSLASTLTGVQMSAPNSATNTFSLPCGKNLSCIKSGTATITVTDALGQTGSAQVSLSFDAEGNR
ncbi:hypothetical protein GCM10011611_67680 [Aliidongia dinghuensis]|uniref:PKD domain-containing protein n=1 Tax=Aliidongia dinghuensis TaxID=1867774 RepID=A0A8J2Z1E8_9PROT|nr:hypothetical protein GCM10011611_67680 [Aliidongia dinghuensis]